MKHPAWFLALLAAVGCAPDTPPAVPRHAGPPDLLLITVDTFRTDRAGCYGNPDGLTPALDRIVRAGRQARHAYAPAPLTAVSHASMLTALEPPNHGVRENGTFPLDPSIPTLGTYLSEHGFSTAAFVSAFPLEGRFGFDSGFDHFDDDLGSDSGGLYYAERPADETVDAAMAWLRDRTPEDRWFVWTHFFDPHHPRNFPAVFRRLPDTDDYGREIRFLDGQLARLLREVRDLGRDPVIAIVSDHGEGLGDHGESSHGILLHDEVMHGVFAVSAPAGTDAATALGSGPLPGVVRYADLVPTLFGVLDLPFTERVDGRSRLAAGDDGEGAYGETYYPPLHYHWSPLLSWRDEHWTYVEGPNPELFDRRTDPGEQINVLRAHPDIAARFRERVASLARDPEQKAHAELDPEAREKLLALGYLSSTAGELTYDPTKDPKELIDSVNALFRGIHLMEGGNAALALTFLQRAHDADPENASALFYLANCLRQLGSVDRAMGYYRQAIEREPGAAEAHAHLALLEFDRGRTEEAFALLDRGLATSPDAFALLMTAGDLNVGRQRFEEAGDLYRRARESSPHRVEAWAGGARVALRLGQAEEAQELWARALELDAESPLLHGGLRPAGGR